MEEKKEKKQMKIEFVGGVPLLGFGTPPPTN